MRIWITILSILLLSGCRTIEKAFSSADSKKVSKIDSSALKTEQNSSRYNRETITEYLVDTIYRTNNVPQVHVVKVPEPYIIRQTVRESGESTQDKTEAVSQVKQEQAQTSETEKEKTATFPASIQISAVMLAGAALIGAITLIIKQFK